MDFTPSLSSKGIIGRIYQRLEGSFNSSWVSRVGLLVPSNEETETYRFAGMAPAMREWKGGRLGKDLLTYQFQIQNKVCEATLRIPIDALRRDKTGQINVRISELARRPAQHWEKLASDLIIAGTTDSGYDAQVFFSAAHTEGASGTQINLIAVGQVPCMNVSDYTAPTGIEAANCLLGCIAYMMGWKDDQGEPINGEARKFVAMAGTAGIFSALAVACSAAQVIGAGNTQIGNPLLGAGFTVEPVFNPRMSSWSDRFGLFRVDGDTRAVILQEEEGPKIDAIAEGSELEINERVHQYSVTASRNAGYGWWQNAALCVLN